MGRDGDHAALAPYLSAHQAAWLARPRATRAEVREGSLLFLDISGFTPLTERLATRGKAGGEELTDHLNHVFGELIGGAHRLGGDVLKFGGDALLLLFSGEGHEARAAAAAWDMQTAIRPFRRLRTSCGTVALQASSALASGPVHLFLAGDVFGELVAAGPTATTCLDFEKEAEATEILLAPATAAALPDGCTRPHGSGHILVARPEAEPVAPATGPGATPRIDPRGGLPPVLHDELEHNSAGEHRRAVVSFLQFRGLDELIAGEGPDAAGEALHALIGTAQAACERHRVTFLGTDVDRAAGKIFLCTGAPHAGDDDVDRMLRALLETLAEPSRLTLRAGVNRGRVFAVHIGAPARRCYTTMGDATNLAARVMGKAADGALLVTEAALEGARGTWPAATVEPFMVKGKSAPVHAAVVTLPGAGGGDAGGAGLAVGAEDVAVPPGRDAESGTLAQALDAAVAARAGALVDLVGAAGMGKSRLVRHAAALAQERGMPVLSLAGAAYDAHVPYLALQGPLRRLFGLAPDAPAEAVRAALAAAIPPGEEDWLGLLGPVVGIDLELSPRAARLDAEAQRRRRHQLAAQAAGEVLAREPSLLVVEDAHWLDDATRDVLEGAARELVRRGCVIVWARRPEGSPPPADQAPVRIDVAAIPARAARRLVIDAMAAGDPLPPDALAVIVRRAEGNPLALGELIAAARAGRGLDELPDDVEALMAVAIDRLAPADRILLRHLSVLGARAPLGLAGAFLEVGARELGAAADRLERFLAREGDAIAFRHALQRQAAYEALPFRERRRLHARAVEVLAQDDAGATPVEVLALHAYEAGLAEKAWAWGREGAERALERGAPSEALTLLAWAVEAGRQVPGIGGRELGAALERRGEAAELAGRYGEAADAYAAARRLQGGEPLVVAELWRRQARMCERRGRYDLALRWATRGRSALHDAGSGPEREAAHGRLDDVSGVARLRQGRAADARRWLQGAVQRLEGTSDLTALAHASYGLAGALVELGELAAADGLSRRALALYEEAGDLVGSSAVLNNLGVDAYWVGDWAQASELLERAAAVRRELGDAVFTAESELNLAELWSDQGRWEDAGPLLRDALAIFRAAPRPEGIGLALSDLGRLAARRGDHDEARDLLAQAVAQLDEIGADGLAYEARVREAERLALAADAPGAAEALASLAQLARRVDASHFYRSTVERIAAWVAAMAGDTDAAAGALEASLGHARTLGSRYEEAVTLDTLAALGMADPKAAADALAALGVVALARPPLGAAAGSLTG